MIDLVFDETRTVVPVREADGSVRRVPNPATPRVPLPNEGARVIVDLYWYRRTQDGDVTWPHLEEAEAAAAKADDDTSPTPTEDQAAPESAPKPNTNTRAKRGESA